MRFTTYLATELYHVGPPRDINEAERILWHDLSSIPDLIARGVISDGPVNHSIKFLYGSG